MAKKNQFIKKITATPEPEVAQEVVKAEVKIEPAKPVFQKKVKVKFIRSGVGYGYAYFADSIVELPVSDVEKLEALKLIVRI